MALSGTIANGVITIALKGLEAAKAELTRLGNQSKKLGEALGTIGSASTRGFAVATGSILGLVKAADPVRFEIFQQKLMILALYVGKSFIPILDDAIGVVDRLIDYFKNLTDEQREQILHWTKIGTGILAAGAALGGVVAVLPKLIGLLRAVQIVVGLLMAETGIGLVLALAGAVVGVLALTGNLDKLKPVVDALQRAFTAFMSNVLEPLMDVFGEVAAAAAEHIGTLARELAPVFTQIGRAIGDAARQVLPVLLQVGRMVAQVFGQVASTLGQLVADLAPVLGTLAREFGQLLADVAPVFLQLAAEVGRFVGQVAGMLVQLLPPLVQIAAAFLRIYVVYQTALARVFLALVQAATSALPALVAGLGVFMQVVDALIPVLTEFMPVVAEVLDILAQLAAEVVSLAGDALAELVRMLAELFTAFWRAFGPDIINAIRGVVSFARSCLDIIKAIVKEAKELVDTVKSLNPFRRQQVTERTVRRPSGAGDFSGGSGSASGPEDFGGGSPASGGGGHWMDFAGRLAGQLAGAVGRASGQASNNSGRFSPMQGFGKVEQFGIEEAFRKAQTGAQFDPQKMYQQALLQEQRQGNAYARETAQNTRGQPAALSVR